MGDWLDYALSDFLLFAPQVYWRLFELENAKLWPLQLVTPILFVAALLWATRAPRTGFRVLALLLAIAWASVGWNFMLKGYAPINWAMEFVAPFFALQALLWLWIAFRPAPIRKHVLLAGGGAALCVVAIFVYPFLAPAFGRPLAGAEVVGIAPDPTALLSIGVAMASLPGSTAQRMILIPLLWLLSSAATLFVLGAAEAALIVACVVVVAVLCGLGRSRQA